MDNIDDIKYSEEIYKNLGISESVYSFCNEILIELTKRSFEKIDKISEYNQLKVLYAMQKIESCSNASEWYKRLWI